MLVCFDIYLCMLQIDDRRGCRSHARADMLLSTPGLAPNHDDLGADFGVVDIDGAQRQHFAEEIAVPPRRGHADILAVAQHPVGIHEAALVAGHFHVVVGLLLFLEQRRVDVGDVVSVPDQRADHAPRIGDFFLERGTPDEVMIELDVLAPAEFDRASVPVADVV